MVTLLLVQKQERSETKDYHEPLESMINNITAHISWLTSWKLLEEKFILTDETVQRQGRTRYFPNSKNDNGLMYDFGEKIDPKCVFQGYVATTGT